MSCSPLLQFAPQVRPRLWFFVDTACCAYSFLLLFLNAIGSDDSIGKAFVKGNYVFYSWITTTLWLLLINLDIAHSGFDAASWKQRVELLIAAVFTASSCGELLEWKLRDQNIRLMGIDTLASGLAYLYKSREAFLVLDVSFVGGYEAIGSTSDPAATSPA